MDRIKMNIISVESPSNEWEYPRKFYIDCPLDLEMHPPQLKRIEIPRALALYIRSLQEENLNLRTELKKK